MKKVLILIKNTYPFMFLFSYIEESRSEFFDFQRVQILYMLRSYLAADTSSSTIPSLRVHILCGEGRLFTAFRQEMSLGGLLAQPHESFSIIMDPELNVLNHGESLYFEAIGPDIIRLHDSLSLLRSANIPEEQRLPTSDSLQLTSRDLKYWIRNRLSPCSLTYFMAHKERLSLSVLYSGPLFHKRIARLLRQEWYPYLAGSIIYICYFFLMRKFIDIDICVYYFRIICLFMSCPTNTIKWW